MSVIAPRKTPFRPLRRRVGHDLLAKLFPIFAQAATWFGLLMLLVFFYCIGRDSAHWFGTMPGLVQEQNAAIEAQLDKARDLDALIAEEMRQLDAEMQGELRLAASADEKAEIRRDFEKIKTRKRADMEVRKREYEQDAEHLRPDTSAAALLRDFFTRPPSNLPQETGIMPALLGSFFLGLITIACAVPLGVGAAVYLEEYRSRRLLAKIIQININNLAGVPSVMYGILGAAVFVDLIFRPLESDTIAARNLLGGGLTLALLTLPVIIIASQEALRTVPQSLRHAAYAVGATRWQVVWHVILPASIPGILTGVILALSRALGEAAPLVMFGALLYVDHNPSLLGRFTVLPMQIFGWTSRPEDTWRYNAALASAVLILLLLALNAAAIWLRQRSQKHLKW